MNISQYIQWTIEIIMGFIQRSWNIYPCMLSVLKIVPDNSARKTLHYFLHSTSPVLSRYALCPASADNHQLFNFPDAEIQYFIMIIHALENRYLGIFKLSVHCTEVRMHIDIHSFTKWVHINCAYSVVTTVQHLLSKYHRNWIVISASNYSIGTERFGSEY